MSVGLPDAACARLLVAARIVQLGYQDSGFEAEVKPGYGGEYVQIKTPHCLQGDRLIWESGPLEGDWFADRVGASTGFGDELQAEALRASGAKVLRTRRHLGCFHRRTRGVADELFGLLVKVRVMLDSEGCVLSSGLFVSGLLPTWHAWTGRELQPRELHRVYAILDAARLPLVLASTGGTIATREAAFDLTEMRWSALDDAHVVDAILNSISKR